ncbi:MULTISPECIES: sensor histidine kinase [Pseudoalteromonas]|uniref:Histidine kinase n=1 Tax=Pseudoalteromonas rubra TaxID=43658 RepID=A0A0L0ES65_9GAMM|nr:MULTISPECIES: histidine kinase [Pseudoalteromonas]ALU42071.1 histidine kinase [Pseudoalteromonas rubra]KNC67259.1 histidine kinase [Pseudoalteromonas rubra]MDK1310962.1 histidine kinase [Pseudoalteromonas sp. R96]
MKWQALVDNRQRFFWVLQIAGWIGYALVNYIGSKVFEMRDIYVFVIVLNAYAGCLMTVPLRYLYRKVWNAKPLLLIFVVFSTSYLTGTLWSVVQKFNMWEIYRHGYRPEEWYYYLQQGLDSVYIILCWSGLYFGIKYYQLLQSERQKALKANTMAHEAQLKMLRYQLNPHFLFNTLNAISTLVLVEENKDANQMVSRLSDFLRYTLNTDPIKKVPLEQELHALKLYLNIEKVRFDERLEVAFDITEEAKQALVPSLIMQPLIENSIKYAIAHMASGGKIEIRAQVFANELLLEVCDNGPGASIENGQLSNVQGVGIANTQDRLRTLYENNYSFVLAHNTPSGLKVNIRVPFEKAEK